MPARRWQKLPKACTRHEEPALEEVETLCWLRSWLARHRSADGEADGEERPRLPIRSASPDRPRGLRFQGQGQEDHCVPCSRSVPTLLVTTRRHACADAQPAKPLQKSWSEAVLSLQDGAALLAALGLRPFPRLRLCEEGKRERQIEMGKSLQKTVPETSALQQFLHCLEEDMQSTSQRRVATPPVAPRSRSGSSELRFRTRSPSPALRREVEPGEATAAMQRARRRAIQHRRREARAKAEAADGKLRERFGRRDERMARFAQEFQVRPVPVPFAPPAAPCLEKADDFDFLLWQEIGPDACGRMPPSPQPLS